MPLSIDLKYLSSYNKSLNKKHIHIVFDRYGEVLLLNLLLSNVMMYKSTIQQNTCFNSTQGACGSHTCSAMPECYDISLRLPSVQLSLRLFMAGNLYISAFRG